MRLSTAALLRVRRESIVEERVRSGVEHVLSAMESFNVSLDVAVEGIIKDPALAKEVKEAIEKEEKENQEESEDVPIDGEADLYEEYDYYGDDSSLENETDVDAEAGSAVDAEDDSLAMSPLEDRTPSYGGVSGYQEFWKENSKGSEKGKSKDRDEGR